MTVAASGSSPGSTRSRLETSVDLATEPEIGLGQLGAGDARPDDDEVLGSSSRS
jgi:hypothetical protein